MESKRGGENGRTRTEKGGIEFVREKRRPTGPGPVRGDGGGAAAAALISVTTDDTTGGDRRVSAEERKRPPAPAAGRVCRRAAAVWARAGMGPTVRGEE